MSIFYEPEIGPTATLSDLLEFYELKKGGKIAIAHVLAETSDDNRVAPFWGGHNVQYAMESRADGFFISPCSPFIPVRPNRDEGDDHEALCLKIESLGAMLMDIGIGTPMSTLCDESMDSVIARAKEDRHLPRDFWDAAEWCSGFSSKEAGENPKITFEKQVTEPLAQFNHKGGQNKQICALKAGVVQMQKTPKDKEKEAQNWLARNQATSKELCKLAGETQPVHVAVLDTGCNTTAPYFYIPDVETRLKEWTDFASGSENFVDTDGHGTYVVSLISRMAPAADLYVARISKTRDVEGANRSIIQAITWANEKKVDIVVLLLAFGFPEKQDDIAQVIEQHSHMLFFGAASNHGANYGVMFPASHDAVICIRATDSNGVYQLFNPPKDIDEREVFGTLGVDVPAASLGDFPVLRSGTSVATAIAAGIAATLVHCGSAASLDIG